MALSGSARIARGFDRLAPVYDLLLALGSGNAIPRVRRALLAHIPVRRNALVLGDGTGGFLCELMATGRIGRATCIDISPEMTARARARWKRTSRRLNFDEDRVRFYVAGLPLSDAEIPGGPFDLVCTNFFLDLFTDTELATVFRQIQRVHAAGALWYDSDFQYPDANSRPIANRAARGLVRILYLFFAGVCGLAARRLPDVNRVFQSNGYRVISTRIGAAGLLIGRIFQKI